MKGNLGSRKIDAYLLDEVKEKKKSMKTSPSDPSNGWTQET